MCSNSKFKSNWNSRKISPMMKTWWGWPLITGACLLTAYWWFIGYQRALVTPCGITKEHLSATGALQRSPPTTQGPLNSGTRFFSPCTHCSLSGAIPKNHFCFGFYLLFELACFSSAGKLFLLSAILLLATKLNAHVNRLVKRFRFPWMLRHYNNIVALCYFPRTKCILQQSVILGLEHGRTDKQTEIRTFQAAHCVGRITLGFSPLWPNSFLICVFTAYPASTVRMGAFILPLLTPLCGGLAHPWIAVLPPAPMVLFSSTQIKTGGSRNKLNNEHASSISG